MDVGLTSKLAPAAGTPANGPDAAAAGRLAARTELPAVATVQPATAAPSLKLDISDTGRRIQAVTEAAERQLQRDVEVDETTREPVVKYVDPDSGVVVRQVPEAEALRLKAYVRAVLDESAPAPGALARKEA